MSVDANPVRVSIVGAGPGDPELLTVKALRRLQTADVVLHDALVPAAILALAPQATKIAVGKRAGGASTEQVFINRLLVESAQRHQRVVRLKGGDPAIFGRLDEELAALRAAHIAFEIVPGVTAASAAAADLQISLTQRGVARALTLVTPRVGRGFTDHDWHTLVAAQSAAATVAVYMPGEALHQTAATLLTRGLPARLPCAVVEAASLPQQQHWRGTLGQLAFQRPTEGTPFARRGGPVLLLLGEALRLEAALHEDVPRARQALAA